MDRLIAENKKLGFDALKALESTRTAVAVQGWVSMELEAMLLKEVEERRIIESKVTSLVEQISKERADLFSKLSSVSTQLDEKAQEVAALSELVEEERSRARDERERREASEKKLAALDEKMVPAMWDLVFKLDSLAKKRGAEAVALKKRKLECVAVFAERIYFH